MLVLPLVLPSLALILLVAAGVYYLLEGAEDIVIDDKVHTLTKLHDVLEDVYHECAFTYHFYYNLILTKKEMNSLSKAELESVKN